MVNAGDKTIPQSPETQPPEVREELAQSNISHDGVARDVDAVQPGDSSQLGAVEDEVTPIAPPMQGPGDLVGDEDSLMGIDPVDEITPG